MKQVVEEPKQLSYYQTKGIKSMSMGRNLMISPYDAMWYYEFLDTDSKLLPLFANSNAIRKYLPGLNFSNPESTKKTLLGHILRTEKGFGFSYFIRINNAPIGMILVNSPLYNGHSNVLNLNIWTIDFFIAEAFEHKGIMYAALLRVLNQLKNMKVTKIYCMVDSANISCINLINQGLFEEVDNGGFHDRNNPMNIPMLFGIDLSTIKFVKS